MERKKLKKLELKKQTIVELSELEADRVHGGFTTVFCAASTWNCIVLGIELSAAVVGTVAGGGGNQNGGGYVQPSGTDACMHTGPNGEQICVITEVAIEGSLWYC